MQRDWGFRWQLGLWLLLSLVVGSGCGSVITPPPPTATQTSAASAPGTAPAITPTEDLPAVPLTPIPPTPTFTPTPSPTPVIHIVGSGDTLFGIAIEYGVASEAIQETNGLDNPNALSIGQSLIIPIGEDEAEPAVAAPQDNLLLPTPTPVPLDIQGIALYPTAVGGVWCVGEIRNTAATPMTNLQARVTLVGADGGVVASEIALAAADYLPPERTAPFAVLFTEDVPENVDVQITLLRAETVGAITAAFVPLPVEGTEGAFAGPQYQVSGRAVNDGGYALARITVVVTLRDAEGRVLAYRQAVLDAAEIGDATTPFAVLLTPRGDSEPAAFDVLAWGHRAN